MARRGAAPSTTPDHLYLSDAQGIFNLSLRATQGLPDLLFELMNAAGAPDYTQASKRASTIKVSYRQPPKGQITDLVIDSTGLKVFGEGEEGQEHAMRSAGYGASCIWRWTLSAMTSWRQRVSAGECP